MSRFVRVLEITTNSAVLILCCLLGFLVVQNRLGKGIISKVASPAMVGPQINSRLNIPGINWSKSPKTIVMAISTECHFCSASMPFYRRLVDAARQKNERVIAFLPQKKDESQAYLQDKQIAVDEVLQGSLDSLQVHGTPTLLLVDANGRVTKSWVGQLPHDIETQVLGEL